MTAPDPVDGGAMADRVLEAKNEGVAASVVRRRERILAELAERPGDPWAAEYYEGDGLGENMSLYVGAKSGVAATWFGCMGLYGANEGEIAHIDVRTLGFRFSLPNKDSRFGMFPDSVRLVRWGERRYLIPEARAIDFVNAINRNMEPRHEPHGLFLLAEGDEKKRASGAPDLTADLLSQIRSKALVVRASAVERGEEHEALGGPVCQFRLRFALPPGERVLKGLEFSADERDVYDTAIVLGTEGNEVSAQMVFSEKCADVPAKPAVGWVFSTGSFAGQGDASSL